MNLSVLVQVNLPGTQSPGSAAVLPNDGRTDERTDGRASKRAGGWMGRGRQRGGDGREGGQIDRRAGDGSELRHRTDHKDPVTVWTHSEKDRLENVLSINLAH